MNLRAQSSASGDAVVPSVQPHVGTYQAHVDGLRAIAVLAVILFHIDPHWLPGGFVGVDIFFVISGYLITGIVAREMETGRFSFKAFYERRIRRILPALWTMLAVTMPLAWWVMLPENAEPMAKSAMWSVLSLANVYFWREVSTDYFQPESSQMPFLHLWSLGVEEQFYLLWPPLLLMVYALGRQRARACGIALSLLVVVLATVVGEWLLASGANRFAYYMIPSRAGELAVGGALAFTGGWPTTSPHVRRVAPLLGVLGWVLVGASVGMLSEAVPFPGWRALLPTVGTVLLIAAGLARPDHALIRPLGLAPVVGIGRSSYSAYLWHWPILALWRYLWGQPGTVAGVAILIGILALSEVTRRFVEDPARKSHGSFMVTAGRFVVVPAAALLALGYVMARGPTWWPLYPAAQRQAWATLASHTAPVHHMAWVCQQHVLDPATLRSERCEFGAGSDAARILLVGDSQAAHFAPVVRAAAEASGVRVRTIAIGGCAPLPGDLDSMVTENHRAACRRSVPAMLERAEDFPVLMFGGAWAMYAARDAALWPRLEAYLRALTARGHIVVLLPRVTELVGFDAACERKHVRVGAWLQCPRAYPPVDPEDRVNARLAEFARTIPGVKFLALEEVMCRASECPATDDAGRVIYSDPSHLSAHGARHIAELLAQRERLPNLRAYLEAR